MQIWSLDTGKLVAGPLENSPTNFKVPFRNGPSAVRLSPDLKKLAVSSYSGKCLEVWDVQAQKLDAIVGKTALGAFEFGSNPLVEVLDKQGNYTQWRLIQLR
jgi:hypothetical protein